MNTLHTQVNWTEASSQLIAQGQDYVLVTLLGTRGSTPRGSGTKMVVSANACYGTIGGGHLEFKTTKIATDLLREPEEQQRIEHFPLGPSLGQCCGGSTSVLFESFKGTRFNIMLFGAGHVGQALTGILQQLPCRLNWVDSREAIYPDSIAANVTPIACDRPTDEVADMPIDSYYLIMTHNHQLDFEILEAVLQRGDARYVGLIGSNTKWRRFQMRLEHKGYDKTIYQQVHCPIGLSAVPGKRPIEVAVSIAAELIATEHACDTVHPTQRGVSRQQIEQVVAGMTDEA